MAERVYIDTDLLIIGGGTAGCMAAWEARRVAGPDLKITILEKAFIRHSGCLAAGMNALNMYINQGSPEDYVAYARYDLCGAPIREDILLSVAKEVNETVAIMEKAGLPMKRKEDGRYLNRGKWNIEINGSHLKPITASMANEAKAKIVNRVYVTNILMKDGKAVGAVGFGVRDGKFYVARAKAVLIAAGGAAGLWRPAAGGDAHHRIWYFPFNTGASYAMCKRSGCEMTGFDMRLVAVRTKDSYSPTGTLQIGMDAPMVNAQGRAFMKEDPYYINWGGHSAPTPIRVLGFCRETENHRGPVYIDTSKGDPYKVTGLKGQYLDMSPNLVLYWGCNDIDPSKEPIEIEASDPALVGAHSGCSGAWTPKEDRMTTVTGLFVSGDALGATPSRFISGSWTCGRIAARYCVEYIQNNPELAELDPAEIDRQEEITFRPMLNYQERSKCGFWTNGTLKEGVGPSQMEDHMQRIMEEYCGGRSRWFFVSEDYLKVARKRIHRLRKDQIQHLCAGDLHELQLAWDVINRLDICHLLIEHISYRKETRYPGYVNRTDFPEMSSDFDCFCNSVCDPETDQLTFYKRPYVKLIPGDRRKETI